MYAFKFFPGDGERESGILLAYKDIVRKTQFSCQRDFHHVRHCWCLSP